MGAFSIAEVIPTNSSGNEVPSAKIIAEKAKIFVWVLLASLVSEVIRISAYFIKMSEKKRIEIISAETILDFF